MADVRLIETDAFPFEFLSRLAERESWRKEIHRPIYHVHKWWAKRLGSVFRGILLGSSLSARDDLATAFYQSHDLSSIRVFDPFMGSGTTVGEAHKLGCAALGRDINPVAVRSVRTALGPIDPRALSLAFQGLSEGVGKRIRELYRSQDASNRRCDVLYHFWVMQTPCPACGDPVDLFPSWIIGRNAYPNRKPEVQVLCPECGDIFPALNGQDSVTCRSCRAGFDPHQAIAKGTKATCPHCREVFPIIDAVARYGRRPDFRLYGKLVLTQGGTKQYLPASEADRAAYAACSTRLLAETRNGEVRLPQLLLTNGYNTRQAMSYGFQAWRDFFNDRQLLALGWLHSAILRIDDAPSRDALLTLFSGVLEFNNMFASYKGEGTGAVRHMFSHHILKPERTPIEANVWGTSKSSGSFSGLYRGRLMRAIDYRSSPTEVGGSGGRGRVCSPPFSGQVDDSWPVEGAFRGRSIYLSCGDSSGTGLPDQSIDLIVTDPPFFDNVHYSELADFFHAWQLLTTPAQARDSSSTRHPREVQDSNAASFASKLRGVFEECHRILLDDGLLVFTYHHSREDGWHSLAAAVLGSGFVVVNAQPVKAEMSVATPKSQAKEPIQLDMILVCRKANQVTAPRPDRSQAIGIARRKLRRLAEAGFRLSSNDRKVVLLGQLLTTVASVNDASTLTLRPEDLEASPMESPAHSAAAETRFLPGF